MRPKEKRVLGENSWTVSNPHIELTVTKRGGQMAPVTFFRDSDKPIQPYYVSPWAEEAEKPAVEVLKPLRGDFFCMPFGGDNAYGKEDHPVHGDTASGEWSFSYLSEEGGITDFALTMTTTSRPGEVTKRFRLKEGRNALYIQHVLSGYKGKMCLGHHAILSVPEKEDSMMVKTSPTLFGYTLPRENDVYSPGEYYSIASGTKFESLKKVPTVWKHKSYDDGSLYPRRKGFMDVYAVFSKKEGSTPSWTVVAVPDEGYLFYTLKDPEVLPCTQFWMDFEGRHMVPWNGRNRCFAVEDAVGYLAAGLAPSVKKNPISEAGVSTYLTLSPKTPTFINHIQGMVKIPKSFSLRSVRFEPGKMVLTPISGKAVETEVDWEFLTTGHLE